MHNANEGIQQNHEGVVTSDTAKQSELAYLVGGLPRSGDAAYFITAFPVLQIGARTQLWMAILA